MYQYLKLLQKHCQAQPEKACSEASDRYRVQKKLGSGSFGTAFLVADSQTKRGEEELKVLKEIRCPDLNPEESRDTMKEAQLLANLRHTGIVKFYESFLDGSNFCLITEYCEGGDLENYIKRMRERKEMIPERQIMDWMVQLLQALHYIHTQQILHRDLKPSNVFLKNNRVKIGDFGLSRILMMNDLARTWAGTPIYMSPERFSKKEGYNCKSDIWSVGCIIYELCCQKYAFSGVPDIVEGDTPVLSANYSKELNNVLKQLFIKDPQKRPSALEVLNLRYISQRAESLVPAVCKTPTALTPYQVSAGSTTQTTIMEVFLVSINDRMSTLNVTSTDSVDQVKRKVLEKEGIPIAEQRLILGTKQLENGKNMSDYPAFQKGCHIHLLLRMNGGIYTRMLVCC